MFKTNNCDLSVLGMMPDIAKSFSNEQSLEMFRRMCNTRYFELKVCEAIEKNLTTCPIYLSLGQEAISAASSTVIPNCLQFAQHRAHSVYLAFGGDPAKLRDELLGLETGCSRGRGGSPAIQDWNSKMIGHHGLVGENIPLAVGAALGDPSKPVISFFGDAAAEEDYALAAIGFAATHKLPVLFVCEDNNLSILTEKKVRRSWETTDVASAMGMPSVDITDDPWLIAHYVKKFSSNLPAFINCRTCRHRWHVGAGIDAQPTWDRLELVRKQLEGLELLEEAKKIEQEAKQRMEELWEELLQKR